MAKYSSSIPENYILERVPVAEETQKLETQAVYVGTVSAQQVSKVLQFANKKLPKLEGIEHVKRVKRTNDGTSQETCPELLVLLCQCHEISRPELDALLAADTEWGTGMQVTVHQVPSKPPYTREQFEEWKTLWPVAYRPLTQLKPVCFGEQERAYICSNLAKVSQMCEDTKEVLAVASSVILASPETRSIIAQSIDQTTVDRHPLRHAAMCCIASVSAASEIESNIPDDTKSGGGDCTSLVPAKRHAPSAEDNPAVGYLCEGRDIFASREPCVMCCMALVHSRIGRLFFIEPRESGGISHYSMHSLKALNHHFTAFQCTKATK
ncbi:tRNA-specific adenosine deaminase subunit tad3 [Coemansia sp. RSA 1933]|nr:tRNA-specific adenosine deaminase subunit tad3 [Coemansia sp. RSA 1933]